MIQQEIKTIEKHKVFACLGLQCENVRENENGNFALKTFFPMEQPFFDGRLTPNGFYPVFSDQIKDDWLCVNVWGSLENLCLVSYANGHLEIFICPTEEQYKRELQYIQ